MEKKKVYKMFVFVVIVFVWSLIFINVRQYLKMNDTLKYFEKFYSAEEMDILKKDIEPIQKSIDSEKYKISLKGVWAQGNSANCIFEIQEKDGTVITQKDIQSAIKNKCLENNEDGKTALAGQEFQENGSGNHIIGIRILGEENVEELVVEIKIKEEQFLFTIPISLNYQTKQVVCVNDDADYVYERVYITPISMYSIISLDREPMNTKICLNFLDGKKQEIETSDGYVSYEEADRKVCMRLFDSVYDVGQLESVTVGNIKYKVVKNEEELG